MGYKFSNFKTDTRAEVEGVWVDFGSDFKVKIGRLGNPKCQEYSRRIQKPYKRQIDNETIDPEITKKLLRKALARYVLLDWKGLEEDDGKVIEYSVEKAEELLETKDFFAEIMGLSQDMDLFKQETQEENLGNL